MGAPDYDEYDWPNILEKIRYTRGLVDRYVEDESWPCYCLPGSAAKKRLMVKRVESGCAAFNSADILDHVSREKLLQFIAEQDTAFFLA